jgi:hypothetical protein
MPNLIEPARPEVQPGRGLEAGDSVSNRHFDAAVSHLDEGAELVDREEVPHAVAELLGHVAGVVGERLGRVARLPAAVLVLQGLRQVPVVERGERLDAGRLQLVHETVVEVQALRVRLTGPVREDARPANREAVRGRADVLHQRDVLLVPVVVVVGDVAGVVVRDLARRVGERVPDRRALAVLVPRALDLVGRRGRAPEEAFRELPGRFGLRLRLLLRGRLCGGFERCGRRRERGARGDHHEIASRPHGVVSLRF